MQHVGLGHCLSAAQAGSGSNPGLPQGPKVSATLLHCLSTQPGTHGSAASGEKCTLREALQAGIVQQAFCKAKRIFPVLASVVICEATWPFPTGLGSPPSWER